MKDWESKFQKCIHKTKIKLPEQDNPSLFPPLYDSIKYSFNKSNEIEKLFSGERHGFLYSRYKNPNSEQLINTISNVQNKEYSVLCPNGISAITLALESLCYPNACVMFFTEAYSPTKSFIKNQLSKWGVENISCNIDDHDEIVKIFKEQSPDILIFESPTNPQLKIADIQFLLNLCKEQNCISIMDNTFASLHQHNQYDIDIVIHSLSKYASGHGDIMGGSISTNDSKKYKDIQDMAHAKGVSMEPEVARKFYKSLQTFPLRYKSYSRNAFQLAKKLQEESTFSQVIYPGLKTHPEYELAQEQQISPGNVIYFEIPHHMDLYDYIDRLKTFTLSPSLGSNESLIAPVQSFYGVGMSEAELQSANISPHTLRVSIGLEDPNELFDDLSNALK